MVDEAGLTEPAPFSIIVTLVALPLKVLFSTVTGIRPQVLPLVAERVTTGASKHPHDTAKILPTVVQPSRFLTAIRWFPLAIFENTGLT